MPPREIQINQNAEQLTKDERETDPLVSFLIDNLDVSKNQNKSPAIGPFTDILFVYNRIILQGGECLNISRQMAVNLDAVLFKFNSLSIDFNLLGEAIQVHSNKKIIIFIDSFEDYGKFI